MEWDLGGIDKQWTLFLDRDGVINQEIKGKYVLSWEEFHFFDGALKALKILNGKFHKIVVVTNQKCVGKGWLTKEALHQIHQQMIQIINLNNGKIDKIYYCPDLEDTSAYRKPNTGMALLAKKDFPGIEFKKSIMVGNSISDMEFGNRLEMKTIFLTTTQALQAHVDQKISLVTDHLLSFAENFL
ncbi:MAG: D-glycero-alpha-D-manno-heptose-1,7-bisphosphate 7-phosphatase [Chitinophagaceae bacterium]